MLSPSEIRNLAQRKYVDVLRSIVVQENIFPLHVRFGKPDAAEDFAKLRDDISSLANQNFGYTIEWEERKTRKWGTQPFPSKVRFDSERQFTLAIGKSLEIASFKRNVAATLARFPMLQSWLRSNARWVVEFEKDWDGILSVCDYFHENPRPNLYVREIPVPVHTKFIYEHREVLNSLLLSLLPSSAIASDSRTFEERFGLKPLQPMIRFRSLDTILVPALGLTDERMGLPLDRFRILPISNLNIIVTENLMTLECLPSIANGLGVWGQGNAAEVLSNVGWLSRCHIFYWGDIDEHGFHILARMRKSFPHVFSIMMDLETVTDLSHLLGKGEYAGQTPRNLNPSERAAFEKVQTSGQRLEQERIPFAYSVHRIEKAILMNMHLFQKPD